MIMVIFLYDLYIFCLDTTLLGPPKAVLDLPTVLCPNKNV